MLDLLYDIYFLEFLLKLSDSPKAAFIEFILIQSGCQSLEEARQIEEFKVYFKVFDNFESY